MLSFDSTISTFCWSPILLGAFQDSWQHLSLFSRCFFNLAYQHRVVLVCLTT